MPGRLIPVTRLSYGTGRPAVLKDDESIADCRYLLRHPLALDDDMRLVSTVELIRIRERVHNQLSPLEGPVLPAHFEYIQDAERHFDLWYKTWDHAFSMKWPDAGTSASFVASVPPHTLPQHFTAKAYKFNRFTPNYSTMQRFCGALMVKRTSRRCLKPSAISLFDLFKLRVKV